MTEKTGRITPKIKEQILEIRDTGELNMFDANGVQVMAFERDFNELVQLIEYHKEDYMKFIVDGSGQTDE